jgi:hypothetical protein
MYHVTRPREPGLCSWRDTQSASLSGSCPVETRSSVLQGGEVHVNIVSNYVRSDQVYAYNKVLDRIRNGWRGESSEDGK